jgi:hypothetical protein
MALSIRAPFAAQYHIEKCQLSTFEGEILARHTTINIFPSSHKNTLFLLEISQIQHYRVHSFTLKITANLIPE